MVLTLYVDRMSQPSRAVELFCRLCNIEHELKILRLAKGEHRTADFRAINPLQKLPAIEDGNSRLFESHAILRYLFSTRRCQDHWYPNDVTLRSKIDAVLDWHHSNLRRGCAGLVLHRVLAPSLGLKKDLNLAQEAQKMLTHSLNALNNVFLSGANASHAYLFGLGRPTIADLAMVCEIMQLKLLGDSEWKLLFEDVPKVRSWICAVESFCSPHFQNVHEIVYKVARKFAEEEKTEKEKMDEKRNSGMHGKSKL